MAPLFHVYLFLWSFTSLFFHLARARRHHSRSISCWKMLKNLLDLLPFGAIGKGSPPTGPVHSRPSRWWLPERSTLHQICCVFATHRFSSRGFIHRRLPMWSTILHDSPNRSAFLRYLEFGVDVKEFFVEFKGSFQGRIYHSLHPPVPIFQTVKVVKPFPSLSRKLF